jgi:hypothetical protein
VITIVTLSTAQATINYNDGIVKNSVNFSDNNVITVSSHKNDVTVYDHNNDVPVCSSHDDIAKAPSHNGITVSSHANDVTVYVHGNDVTVSSSLHDVTTPPTRQLNDALSSTQAPEDRGGGLTEVELNSEQCGSFKNWGDRQPPRKTHYVTGGEDLVFIVQDLGYLFRFSQHVCRVEAQIDPGYSFRLHFSCNPANNFRADLSETFPQLNGVHRYRTSNWCEDMTLETASHVMELEMFMMGNPNVTVWVSTAPSRLPPSLYGLSETRTEPLVGYMSYPMPSPSQMDLVP